MTFDASEYTKALEGFLVNMGDFQGGKLPYDRMEAAMDPLCSFLRVAKVQMSFMLLYTRKYARLVIRVLLIRRVCRIKMKKNLTGKLRKKEV